MLSHITSEIVREKPEELYSDLPGHCINGTTIPQDILIASGTGSRPDLVILDRVKKKIQEVTLTCPLEDNIHNANTRKLEKYKSMNHDLEDNGFTVLLKPFEVGWLQG